MWAALIASALKAWNGLVKFLGWVREIGIYIKGRVDAAKDQKEQERKEAEDARRTRDKMKSKSDEELDDILGGGSS